MGFIGYTPAMLPVPTHFENSVPATVPLVVRRYVDFQLTSSAICR
jgi:hypothetical protein